MDGEFDMPFHAFRSSTESMLGIRLPCGWRILVVDDFKDTADTLTTLLQLSGNECYTAYSGKEAIALARFHRPEIILLDLNMPEMDGYATYSMIKAEYWSKHVKLIATTGLGSEANRQKTLNLGFDGHIVKPVDPEELASVLLGTGRGQPDLH